MIPGKVALISNLRAATDDALREAIAHYRREGLSIEVFVAWETSTITTLAELAIARGAKLLIAAGGDGTLNRVALAAWRAEEKVELACLPFGTANDFAHGVGFVPMNPRDGLERIFRLDARPIDLGILPEEDLVFVNVATGGFGAEVTATTPGRLKSMVGDLAYVFTGIRRLGELAPHHVNIEADDLSWSQPTLGFALGNARQTGGGFEVCREAKLDDGFLDLVIAPDIPTDAFREYFLGDVANSDRILYRRVQRVVITSDECLHLNVDGEPLEGNRFVFEIAPKALRVRIP